MSRQRRAGRGRALIAIVLSLVLLVVLAVVADRVARAVTESQLERVTAQHLPGVSEDLRIDLGSGLFLPQVLRGEVRSAELTASRVQIDAFEAEQVQIDLRGVGIADPYPTEELVLDAVAPVATLQALLEQADLPAQVDVDVRDGELVASTTVLGVDVEAVVVPQARGRSISLGVDSAVIGGVPVDPATLPAGIGELFSDVEVELQDLPAGLELTRITVQQDTVALQVTGQDIALAGL